jgi:hypothetical protein
MITNNNPNRNKFNNQRGRNNNYKKSERQPKVNPNELKVALSLPADLNNDIANEILDVLASTKFNKISIPLGAYRNMIDAAAEENDIRVCTIGYIKNYDVVNKVFTVIIFDRFLEVIKNPELGQLKMELAFTTYKETSLGTITKFNIACASCENEVEVVEED